MPTGASEQAHFRPTTFDYGFLSFTTTQSEASISQVFKINVSKCVENPTPWLIDASTSFRFANPVMPPTTRRKYIIIHLHVLENSFAYLS